MAPGAITLQVTPWGARASASARVKPLMPPLVAGVHDVLNEMHVTVDRADVDDASGSPFDHVAAGFLAAGDHGDQVDVEDIQPVLGVAFEEFLAQGPAGVVDEDVELAIALDRAGHDAARGIGIAEVGLHNFDFGAVGPQFIA